MEINLYLHLSVHSIFELMEASTNEYTLAYLNYDQLSQPMSQLHHIKLINFYAKKVKYKFLKYILYDLHLNYHWNKISVYF